MTVLTLCRDGSIKVGESITESIADAFRDNMRQEKAPQGISSQQKIRREKIVRVCEQINNGTYDLDERLDAVLERILMDISP